MSGHAHDAVDPPHVVEVADGVFAYVQPDGSWWLNNSGFVLATDGVVALDSTSTERRTRALLDAIRTVTTTPVGTLVNTHHHGDHTHGNYLMPSATIVGHRLCREEMIAAGHIATALFEGVDWGQLWWAPVHSSIRRANSLPLSWTAMRFRRSSKPASLSPPAG